MLTPLSSSESPLLWDSGSRRVLPKDLLRPEVISDLPFHSNCGRTSSVSPPYKPVPQSFLLSPEGPRHPSRTAYSTLGRSRSPTCRWTAIYILVQLLLVRNGSSCGVYPRALRTCSYEYRRSKHYHFSTCVGFTGSKPLTYLSLCKSVTF